MSDHDHTINTLPPDPASRATEVVATQLPAIIRAAYAQLVAERDSLRVELAEAREQIAKPCEHTSTSDPLTDEERVAIWAVWYRPNTGNDYVELVDKIVSRRIRATPTRGPSPGTLLAIRCMLNPALAGVETAHEAIGKVPELITALLAGKEETP